MVQILVREDLLSPCWFELVWWGWGYQATRYMRANKLLMLKLTYCMVGQYCLLLAISILVLVKSELLDCFEGASVSSFRILPTSKIWLLTSSPFSLVAISVLSLVYKGQGHLRLTRVRVSKDCTS